MFSSPTACSASTRFRPTLERTSASVTICSDAQLPDGIYADTADTHVAVRRRHDAILLDQTIGTPDEHEERAGIVLVVWDPRAGALAPTTVEPNTSRHALQYVTDATFA